MIEWCGLEVEVSTNKSFTDTCRWISSMEETIWLHLETLVNQQIAFTDTYSWIICMEVTIWLHGYFHVTYHAGSISENDLLVDKSLTATPIQLILLEVLVKATCWLTKVSVCSQMATSLLLKYSARSVSESDSLVNEILCLQPKGYFHATTIKKTWK